MGTTAIDFTKLPFSEISDWGKCLTSFLQATYDKSGSQSSYDHYKAILMDLLGSVSTTPDRISRDEIERYLLSPGHAPGRVGQPVKYGTFNNRLACIRALYRHASEYRVFDGQGIPQPLLRQLAPTAGIHFAERERPPFRSLSEDQLTAFFSSIQTVKADGSPDPQGLKWRAFFLAAFWLAQRRAVLCNLRWGNIRPSLIREPGHAPRQGYIYTWHGSKGHSRVSSSAEMPPVVYDAIIRYVEASGRLETIKPGQPIFVVDEGYIGQYGYDPDRPIHPMTAWHACKRYAKIAGIDPEAISPHSFRHASALHRYLCGQGIVEIKNALKHSSVDMTMTYLASLAGQADSLPSLMTSKFGKL